MAFCLYSFKFSCLNHFFIIPKCTFWYLELGLGGIRIPVGIGRDYTDFSIPIPNPDPEFSKVGISRSRFLKFQSRPGSRLTWEILILFKLITWSFGFLSIPKFESGYPDPETDPEWVLQSRSRSRHLQSSPIPIPKIGRDPDTVLP